MEKIWHGTAVQLAGLTEEERTELLEAFRAAGIEKRFIEVEEDGNIEVYNHPHALIHEGAYIEQAVWFQDVLKKMQGKDLRKPMCFYLENGRDFIPFDEYNDERYLEWYETVLEENNLKTFGIDERKLNIPPRFFHELYQFHRTLEDKDIPALRYLANLFALLFLAEKTRFERSDENPEALNFRFIIGDTERSVAWRDWEAFPDFRYYEHYATILSRAELGFGLMVSLREMRYKLVDEDESFRLCY